MKTKHLNFLENCGIFIERHELLDHPVFYGFETYGSRLPCPAPLWIKHGFSWACENR
jgi:hypothetical protein